MSINTDETDSTETSPEFDMRPMRAIAADLGYSERQFHRKLNTGDEKCRLAVRQEVVFVYRTSFYNAQTYLDDIAELLNRCDPDVAKFASALRERLGQILDTPTSDWRKQRERRLSDWATTGISDEEFAKLSAELEKLPPKPALTPAP